MKRTFFSGASLLAGAVLFSGTLTAAELDLGNRIGKIDAAEISSAPIKVYNLERCPSKIDFAERRAVVVTVKLNEHRSISVVDYKLELNGNAYPCIALARNDDSFVINSQVMYATGKDRIKLLFFVDGANLAKEGGKVSATLSTMLPGRESSVAVPVTDLGNGALTPASAIPDDGKF